MTHERQNSKTTLNYESAGVNITRANTLVENIKTIAKQTRRPGVIGNIGSFGGLFEIPMHRFKHPILVSGTDGVGTKLKLALTMNQLGTIGIDLVAMCVNDIITLGAEPLFFLDYFATGKLDLASAKTILQGIGEGCKLAGAALIGGETAEMPGVYHDNDFDLAGFSVGIVEKSEVIDGSKVRIDDAMIALASSGPHSNGYSLIREILKVNHSNLAEPVEKSTLGEILLAPTRIYVKPLLQLMKTIEIHAIAHITGGGLFENIPRVLPVGTQAVLDTESWTWPTIFQWLQHHGNVAIDEMLRTFNMGVGMVLCVNKEDADKTIELLAGMGEHAWIIGHIAASRSKQPHVVMD